MFKYTTNAIYRNKHITGCTSTSHNRTSFTKVLKLCSSRDLTALDNRKCHFMKNHTQCGLCLGNCLLSRIHWDLIFLALLIGYCSEAGRTRRRDSAGVGVGCATSENVHSNWQTPSLQAWHILLLCCSLGLPPRRSILKAGCWNP